MIAGDNNSDPVDGDSVPGSMQHLLEAPRVIDPRPGRATRTLTQRGDPFLDTADFNDQAPGNLRADYVLPSHGLVPRRGEVFWPTCDSPLARLNDASDHHLVRQDIAIPGR